MEYIVRPRKIYKEKIVPAMMEEFGYKSVMQVPKLEKIVISQGLGAATADKPLKRETLHPENGRIQGYPSGKLQGDGQIRELPTHLHQKQGVRFR